jgi:hypothetical protein
MRRPNPFRIRGRNRTSHIVKASVIITVIEYGSLPGEIVAKERNAPSRIPRMPGALSPKPSNLQLDVPATRVLLIRLSGIRFGVRHLGAAFTPAGLPAELFVVS